MIFVRGGNLSGCELSGWELSGVGMVRDGGFPGWELSYGRIKPNFAQSELVK